ncbi:MAG: beta-Ala-His dipeptidase [Clostridia bacterium]
MDSKAKKVIDEFLRFSVIPHGSGNEKAIGEYLVNWAKEHNLKCEMDSYGNVIMEKEARRGYENAPCVILQSHMDMVCVAESDKEYDPITDSVEIYRDGDFLKAKGTSLGADDGAGVAMMLYILSDNTLKHPKIRGIFTVEEETSMKGAENLDIKYLDGKYLLNLDWEEKDSISSSCSNTVEIIFNSDLKRVKYEEEKDALSVKIMHLLGGHSGCDINLPRGNAIKLMAEFLDELGENGVEFDLSLFEGGRVKNAICAEAECVIVTNEKDKVKLIAEKFENAIKEEYPNEVNVKFAFENVCSADKISDEDKEKLINFLVSLHSGVFYMSKYTPDFVETSQNIGVLKTNDNLHIEVLARSSSKFHSQERKRVAKALARVYGYKLSIPSENPIWEEKGENDLIRIMKKAYYEVTGNELKVGGVHAGLECAFFASVKPNMQMVSAGPQLYDVHSPKERWEVSSLGETVDFIVKALEMITE